MRRAVLLSLICVFYSISWSQNSDCKLVCNDHVFVSMPANTCFRYIVLEDVIENPATCGPTLVELVYPFGTTQGNSMLGNNFVDRTHLGYTMVYKATEQASGNSCWGYATIEDKAAPPVPCKSATISCFQVAAINATTLATQDACSGAASKVTSSLVWKDLGCDSFGVIGTVTRTILASDAWGNSSTCNDVLTIRKDSLESICAPSTIKLPCRLYCLNGEKLSKNLDVSGSFSYSATTDIKNWDIVTFSKEKSSPYYPTPELLLKIQGKGDPLVDIGVPARYAGTKGLDQNVIIPNFSVSSPVPLGDNIYCIHPDSLVVPKLNDLLLDTRLFTYAIGFFVNTSIINFGFRKFDNSPAFGGTYCRSIRGKTDMYPALGGLCKLTVNYTDEILNLCGAGFKIRREWRIADWCTGREAIFVQYISIEDHVTPSPVITAAPNAPNFLSSDHPGIRDTIVYYKMVNKHDCNATFNINRLNVWDCSNVKQAYTFIYGEPKQPGKVVVLNQELGKTGASITLPGGLHYGKINLIDDCYNECNFPLLVMIGDMTPPNATCDEISQATVDPATCWARVYAKDLDNGSRDNCCDVLHFGIARMDSVEAHRKAYIARIQEICGWDAFYKNKRSFEFFTEEYLSIFDFEDYIDLTECGNNQLILRVFDNCNTAKYDSHITALNEHEWYMAQIYGYYPISYLTVDPTFAILNTVESFFNQTATGVLHSFLNSFNNVAQCPSLINLKNIATARVAVRQFTERFIPDDTSNVNLSVLLDLINDFDSTFYGTEKSFCIPEYKLQFDFQGDATVLPPSLGTVINSESATANYNIFILALCQSLFSDCMINVLVDDKTPPVCEDPGDIYWYCDNVGGKIPNFNTDYEYAFDACSDDSYTNNDGDNIMDYTCRDGQLLPYNEIECKNEDNILDDVSDPTGKVFGWYGCNVYGPAGHVDEHGGIVEPCPLSTRAGKVSLEEDKNGLTSNIWAPIYCHSWLCLDRYDAVDKVKPQSAFFTPVIRSGSRGENVEANQFIVWDNCWIDSTIGIKDEQFIDKCDNGWIKRTWTFKDKCGSVMTCDQKIITKHRSDFEVMFPADVTANCDNDTNLKPGFTGSPMVMDDECELIGVNYEDETFTLVQDACYKIVRTWKIIDWCKYDPNQHNREPDVIVDDRAVADPINRFCVYSKLKDDGDGYMTYTQIIKVVDNVLPVIQPCKSDTVCILGGYNGTGPEIDPLCSVPSYTSPDFTGTDNCTPSSSLRFRWELDVDNDGKDIIKSGPNQKRFTSTSLKVGVHSLVVIGEDLCGNESSSSCLITVRDCKKPTPYCYNGIATVIMPNSGSVTVWATDLNAGSYDNCTRKDSLKFSFDAGGSELSKDFTCANVPNGISATNEVDIYVWDQAGNVDRCRTYLAIQDGSGNICPDNTPVAAAVRGKIITERTEPVEHVNLEARSVSTALALDTDVKGTYAFNGLPVNANISITPRRNDDPLNGVSTLDLVLMQKHILGIDKLKSAYKYIAADIDKSNDITVNDVVELRKLILTLYDKFPNNSSWRFVPKSYTFSAIDNPWLFSEKIEIAGLNSDEFNRDFIGIKVGDINGNAISHSLLGNEVRQSGIPLKLSTLDRSLKAGEETTITFTSDNFHNVSGYQFTLKVAGLEIKSIQPGVLQINESNFGMRRLNEGFLTSSWNDSKGSQNGVTAGADDVLFSIKVKANKDLTLSESLVINSKYTRAEAYNGNLSVGVVLEVGKKPIEGYSLHQNTPNPVKTTTVISYELGKADRVSFQITDVTGRVVRVYTQDGVKGFNQLKINRSDLQTSGVLYYTLEVKEGDITRFTASKKMVVIE